MTTPEHSPSDLLLILALDRVAPPVRKRILEAATRIGSAGDKAHVFTLRPGMEQDPGLREVALLCRESNGESWLARLLPPGTTAGPYRPMVDRSAVHAQAVDAWRRSACSLPPLQPGDMVQLG